jgi:hypothetical protein
MRRHLRFVCFAVFALLCVVTLLAQAPQPPTNVNVNAPLVAPVLNSLSVSSGAVGTTVVLTGTTFSTVQGASTVQFNSTLATATAWSNTSITVTVPAGATTGSVSVTVGPNTSNSLPFTVTTVVAQLCTSATAKVYIRSGASGANNGTDWTNARTTFPSPLVRGVTYCVATGSYAALDIVEAEVTTGVIAIVGATAADHGTATGWTNTFSVSSADGGSQALFANTGAGGAAIKIERSYITIDGNAGGNLERDPTKYGFRLSQPASCNDTPQRYLYVRGDALEATQTNVTVKHAAMVSCGAGAFELASQQAISLGCGGCYLTNSTFSTLYLGNATNSISLTNTANTTMEYLYTKGQWSTGAGHGDNHGEGISVNDCRNTDNINCGSTAFPAGQGTINNTVRWSYFTDCNGTACIAAIGPGNVISINAWKIYGNVFIAGVLIGTSGPANLSIADGGTFYIKDTLIYNNTFLVAGAVFEQCATGCGLGPSGNVVENNLIVSGNADIRFSADGVIVHDYNAFFSPTTTPGSEAHLQTIGSQPLVNPALSGTGDYHLVTDTAAGLTLGSPYNVDADGVTRGVNGNWSRGAYQKP